MTIIQLEYLLAVANYGSFSLAAEKCFVTQPSLSMQVKNLEEELGVIVLDRSKKPVLPTDAGLAVIRQAKEAVQAFAMVREVVSDLQNEISGTLRLGVIPTIAPYLLHRFIPDFVRKCPKVELQIREMMTGDIIRALDRDMLDAAIMAGGTSPEGIREEELFNDRFFAYVSTDHPLCQRSNIRIEDIDVRHLLLLSEGNCLRDQVIELCQAQKNIARQYSFESGSRSSQLRGRGYLRRLRRHGCHSTPVSSGYAAAHPGRRRRHHRPQVKTLAKGAASRKITIAVRRTYVKRSLIDALKESVMNVARN